MNDVIKFGIYKLLLKFGAKKEEIRPEAALDNLISFDATEWNCFLFFLESKYDIDLNEHEEVQLVTVESVVETVQQRLSY